MKRSSIKKYKIKPLSHFPYGVESYLCSLNECLPRLKQKVKVLYFHQNLVTVTCKFFFHFSSRVGVGVMVRHRTILTPECYPPLVVYSFISR